MTTVVVTGAAGVVGRRVCALLAEQGHEVTALDRVAVAPIDGVESHVVDLTSAPLEPFLTDAEVICHLAGVDPVAGSDPGDDLHRAERVLAAAAALGVERLVVRSTAAVYGAWPDNPVPLTEAEPLRPNPDAAWVQSRADIEAAVDRHRRRHGHRIAVLRPAVTVSEAGPDELGRVLSAARFYGLGDEPVPAQFVHADDVAAAVSIAVDQRLDGAFNVAPEGWVDTDTISALVGGSLRVRMPGAVARSLERVGYQTGLTTTPPGYVAFASSPWVVAADRLRAVGWAPTHTNEEAFVAGHRAAPWATISPRRRQELALGVAGAAIAGGLAGGAALLRNRFGRG